MDMNLRHTSADSHLARPSPSASPGQATLTRELKAVPGNELSESDTKVIAMFNALRAVDAKSATLRATCTVFLDLVLPHVTATPEVTAAALAFTASLREHGRAMGAYATALTGLTDGHP